jgi:hypothetical protein
MDAKNRLINTDTLGLVHCLAADLQRRYLVTARAEAATADEPRHFITARLAAVR